MKQRLYYLDYLRVFLTALVILHHTAIAYGAGGSWIYVDIDQSELTLSSILLTLFTAINQSFFMGLFFFLSGYFTPGSYDRKGRREFIKDRLIRLGIPLVFYVFILGPIISYYAIQDGSFTLVEYYINEVFSFNVIHIGPLWFVEALLIFAIVYSIIRNILGEKLENKTSIPFPQNKMLIISALLLGFIAFLIRLFSPVGEGLLGLQWGYFPMYVALFIAGIVAYRNNWLQAISSKLAKRWFIVSLITIPILPIGLIATGALEGNIAFEGGVNVQSILYAFWEPFVAFGFILFLLTIFSSINRKSELGITLSNSAYTVFIIHPAIVVGITMMFHSILLPPLLKFIIVGMLSIVLCFVIASMIIRLPFAKKVL